MMKKILSICLALLVLAPVIAQATALNRIYFLGKGIAVSPSDPLDFKMVSIGVGSIISTTDAAELGLGVLVLDEEKYRLKEVTVIDGHATGIVYLEGEVGSFDVSSIMKGDTEVWAGTLIINGETYYLYVIGAPRKIRAGEIREKVVEYCNKNEDANCSGRIENFCQNNPDDSRCRELFRKYCNNNLDDTRCREYMKEYCKEKPLSKECGLFVVKRSADFCKKNPENKVCKSIDTVLKKNCDESSDTGECKTFCEKYPEKCKILKRVTEKVETAKEKAQAVNIGKIKANASHEEAEGE